MLWSFASIHRLSGKITNCQTGVFAAYVSARGHAFIDRALFLPMSWTREPARLAATHVPEAVTFATKPALVVDMIGRELVANVPFSWVAADAVHDVVHVEGAPAPRLSVPEQYSPIVPFESSRGAAAAGIPGRAPEYQRRVIVNTLSDGRKGDIDDQAEGDDQKSDFPAT